MDAMKIEYDFRVTKAFLKYQETGNVEEWMKDGSSVFSVTATEEAKQIPDKTFVVNGYEILNAIGDYDIDFKTVEPAELWYQISSYTNLLDEKI